MEGITFFISLIPTRTIHLIQMKVIKDLIREKCLYKMIKSIEEIIETNITVALSGDNSSWGNILLAQMTVIKQ